MNKSVIINKNSHTLLRKLSILKETPMGQIVEELIQNHYIELTEEFKKTKDNCTMILQDKNGNIIRSK